ncbi:FAD-dependent oxidoreductase [Dehalococcoidia bacterium]|nr:FAD-dependent oxidoreductase [Dehalococcoidia bacterium]
MSNEFPHLFDPLDIGSVTVRNRLMTTSHWNKLAETDPEGYNLWYTYGDRAKYYWAERAKGGWGLIIAGQMVVHHTCGTGRPSGFLDESIPAYTRIAQAIHEHGAKVFVQINHLGRHRASDSMDWGEVWGPSPVPITDAMGKGQLCKEMEKEDIAEVVAGFAKTALNLQVAGFDGVEVHAAHDYLLDQFLNGVHNRRTDEYGGSLENRLRFTLEVIDAVRQATGPNFAVGVRLNGEWPGPSGFGIDDSIEVARKLQATRQVDFINVTAWPMHYAIAPIGEPQGHLVPYAAAIKKAVADIKVFAIGRIVDPAMAERVLSEGAADMVAMNRSSIADPELPNKVMQGRIDDVRRCTGSGQGCMATYGGPLMCQQNPTVALEKAWGIGTIKKTTAKKNVLIVGGGPAGMEAAIVAARRGHQVLLCDKDDRLGGAVNLAIRAPRHAEMVQIVDWRRRQIDKLGVEVRLGAEVEPDMVAEFGVGVVILATGSLPREDRWYNATPHLPNIPGSGLSHVFTPEAVMMGMVDGAKNVVVVDAVGYYQSSHPLEYLAGKGCQVTGISGTAIFAPEINSIDRPAFSRYVREKGVAFYHTSTVTQIGEDSVSGINSSSGKEFILEGVDAVVLALGNIPNDNLYRRLKGEVPELHRIGDCLSPRTIEFAIHEGHKIGRVV